METPSSFDLNLAIQTWRENLARSAAFHSENVKELESHLRDSIDRLRTPQLSDEEAFLIATRRLGQTWQLESEFGKLNRNSIWLGRALWMLIGIQVWAFFDRLMSTIAGCLFVWGWGNVRHSPSAVGDAWPFFFSMLIQLPALVVAVWLTWKVLRNSDKVGQWVAKQLPERSSFVLCCWIVCSLAVLLYAVVILLPSWWSPFSRGPFYNMTEIRIRSAIVQSQTLMAPVRLVGFCILTLILARKQFVAKKA